MEIREIGRMVYVWLCASFGMADVAAQGLGEAH